MRVPQGIRGEIALLQDIFPAKRGAAVQVEGLSSLLAGIDGLRAHHEAGVLAGFRNGHGTGGADQPQERAGGDEGRRGGLTEYSVVPFSVVLEHFDEAGVIA